MSLVRRYGSSFALPYALTLVLVACESACDLLQPFFLARIIDRGLVAHDPAEVAAGTAAMVATALAGALFALGRNLRASRISQDLGARLRTDTYGALLARPASAAPHQDTGGLITRLTSDVTQVQNFFNGTMRVFFKAPILGLGALVMTFLLDPALVLVPAAVLPAAAWVVARRLDRGAQVYTRVQEALDRLNRGFQEYLSGIRVVRAFGRTLEEEERFSATSAALAARQVEASWVLAPLGPVVGLAVNLGILGVLAAGTGGLWPLGPGKLVAFVNYMTQVLFALLLAAGILGALVRAQASARRLEEVLGAPAEAPAPDKSRPATGGLDVSNLGFQWPGTRTPVFEGLNFTVGPGQTLGVLGTTGSGKTTLAHLLAGILAPTVGRVEGPPGVLVPQVPRLFTGTLRSNLLWARPDASDADLEACAWAAGLADWIATLPQGWDTAVGRGGLTLSGGQRQRLTIARALAARPRLLILDDALSAVDARTEASIRQALAAWEPRPLVVLVAQRAVTVAGADQVLVLEGGRQAAFGPTQALAASSEVYRQILESQAAVEVDRG